MDFRKIRNLINPQRRTIRHPRKAFTLIELLVVVAIIAALSAILFPVFVKVREKARQTMCLSNEQQIGIAIFSYNQDYDDAFPFAFNQAAVSQNGQDWSVLIQPYIKNGSGQNGGSSVAYTTEGGVFQCPDVANPQMNEYEVRDDFFAQVPSNGVPNIPTNIVAKANSPSSLVMLIEAGSELKGYSWAPTSYGNFNYAFNTSEWIWQQGNYASPSGGEQYALESAQGNGDCDDSTPDPWTGDSKCLMLPRYRHNDSTDVLFMDGHVKGITRGNLSWDNDIYNPGTCDSLTCSAPY